MDYIPPSYKYHFLRFRILKSIQEQMYPTLDISVRFFGIDWLHIFRVSYNLIQSVDLMADTLVKGTSTAFSDVLLPR